MAVIDALWRSRRSGAWEARHIPSALRRRHHRRRRPARRRAGCAATAHRCPANRLSRIRLEASRACRSSACSSTRQRAQDVVAGRRCRSLVLGSTISPSRPKRQAWKRLKVRRSSRLPRARRGAARAGSGRCIAGQAAAFSTASGVSQTRSSMVPYSGWGGCPSRNPSSVDHAGAGHLVEELLESPAGQAEGARPEAGRRMQVQARRVEAGVNAPARGAREADSAMKCGT